MIVYNWFTCSICFVHEYWLHCSSSDPGFKRLQAKCKKKEVKIGEPMIRTQAIELIVILFLPLTKRNFANK